MKKTLYILLATLFIFMQGASWADEKGAGDAGKNGGLEELKTRVDTLEEMMKNGVVTDELGHKLHPIHSLYGLKITGGLTMTAQGAAHLKGAAHRGAFALSGDLALESPVGKDGRAVVVLDVQQGAGLQVTPNVFFAGPNGNPTGPNTDVESFNNDAVHLAQLYYEHKILEDLVISMGQLDITGYFDANSFANNERMQFLANIFVNNPAIEFGGSGNFYGPGVRLTYSPAGNIDLTAGAFEGNGDYANTFDNPFVMAETDLKAGISGKEGNYRAYYWTRHGRTDTLSTANPLDADLQRATNSGIGISLDQMVSASTGVWLRAGTQREKVAQFDRFIGAGVNIKGICGREKDVIGLGYGASFMGRDYEGYLDGVAPGFRKGAEHYMEAYYNIAVSGAVQNRGFHISPDIQYALSTPAGTGTPQSYSYTG
ncbi:MAG: hypothetical protein HZB83_02640 [Deltaproteobacteria bacterium]|nr:hypothetical protein [Deltaproteobacteria bacterium]